MQRCNEVDAKMGGYFNHTTNGNMQLTRSLDKKLISLCSFDSSNPEGHYFHVKAWLVRNLKSFKISIKLSHGLNHYYKENINSFDHMEQMFLINNNLHAVLVYVEKRDRQFKEIQNYEVDINKKVQNQNLKKHLEQPSYIRRSDPRKARKYVIFEIATGKVIFEYRGVHSPLKAYPPLEHKKDDDDKKKTFEKPPQKIELYELGLIFEENIRKGSNLKLNLFVTGDFLPKDMKDKALIYKWGLC